MVLFTGKERDAETGLDYFGARYYSGAQRRFTSPDSPFADQNPFDPQSWNLYSYVRNNPLIGVDPTGRSCVNDDSSGKAVGDDGDGKGCVAVGVLSAEDVKKKGAISDTQGDPAVNVHGGSIAATEEVKDAVTDFLLGYGLQQIEYGRDDPFTQSFQKSAGMDAINERITANCSKSTGRIAVGTGEAFVNALIDGIAGGQGFRTPEAQLGAFSATYVRSPGRVDVTVTNPISMNSLFLHIPAKVGIKDPKTGPLQTITQTLHIVAGDPCAR